MGPGVVRTPFICGNDCHRYHFHFDLHTFQHGSSKLAHKPFFLVEENVSTLSQAPKYQMKCNLFPGVNMASSGQLRYHCDEP